MKCIKCGTEVNKNAKFCRTCGAPIELQNIVEDTSTATTQIDNKKDIEEKIENTDELFFGKTNSSKKIEEILNEMSPEEKTPDEATMLIPSDLIKKYVKNNPNEKNDNKVNDSIVSDNKEEKVEQKVDDEKTESKVEENKEDKNDLIKLFSDKEEEKQDKSIETSNEEKKDDNKKEEENELNKIEEEKKELEEKQKAIEKKQDEINIKEDLKKENVKNEVAKEKIVNDKLEEKIEDEEIEIKTQKPHYGKNFFVFFIIFVCICAIGYLVYVLYTSRDELEKIDKENIDLKEQLTTIKAGKETKTDSTNYIVYNGYKFSSENMNYSIEDNSLVLKMDSTTYMIKINNSVKYDSIKDKKEEYKNKIINSGYILKSYGNKHVDNRDYYVFETTDKSGKKYIIAYSELDAQSVVAFIISNDKNNLDYNILQNTNLIINSATKDSESKNNNYDIFVEK